jgi:hypothetical protein
VLQRDAVGKLHDKRGEKRYGAVEVAVFWDDCLLGVHRSAPPETLVTSADPEHATSVAFVLPWGADGVGRVPLVQVRRGEVSLVVPPGVSGEYESGATKGDLADLTREGLTKPYDDVPEALVLPFPQGARARLRLPRSATGQSECIVLLRHATSARRTRKPWRPPFARHGSLPFVLVSLLAHAGIVALAMGVSPPAWAVDDQEMSKDQLFQLATYLNASAEREIAWEPLGGLPERKTAPTSERSWEAVVFEPGGSWSPAWSLYPTVGLIHVFSSESVTARYLANLSPPMVAGGAFGALFTVAPEHVDKLRFYSELHEAIEYFPGPERSDRFAGNVGANLDTSETAYIGVSLRSFTGAIPSEAILGTARSNMARLRICYDAGLRRNPLLRGKVGIALTIDNDGRVTRAERFGSDLPDAGVVACVTHAYRLQPFPQPDTGVIRAELQIVFAPISSFKQVLRAAAPLPLDPPVARAPRSAPR